MKTESLQEHQPWTACLTFALGLGLALAWLGGGCATHSGASSSGPKPGRGIAEYREVARGAHRCVATTVKALEGLSRPGSTGGLPPGLPAFDRALEKLELDSVKARAHAEAIIARGQAYFDEWKEQLSQRTNNAAAARAEKGNYDRLLDQFVRVRQRSGEVREEFRPFMNGLREYRARLDPTWISTHRGPAAGDLEQLTARGRRVLQTLEGVLTALDEAEVEVKATFGKL